MSFYASLDSDTRVALVIMSVLMLYVFGVTIWLVRRGIRRWRLWRQHRREVRAYRKVQKTYRARRENPQLVERAERNRAAFPHTAAFKPVSD